MATSGTWQISHEAEGEWSVDADQGSGGWKHIAVVRGNCEESAASREEAESNARLIAAAPELLAAAKEMTEDLISRARFGLNESKVPMLQRAQAAIHKAGQQ